MSGGGGKKATIIPATYTDYGSRSECVSAAWERYKRDHQKWSDENPKAEAVDETVERKGIPKGYSIAFNGKEYRFHDRCIGVSKPFVSYWGASQSAWLYDFASENKLERSLDALLDDNFTKGWNWGKWPKGWAVVTHEVVYFDTVTVTNYVTVTNVSWNWPSPLTVTNIVCTGLILNVATFKTNCL